MIESTFKDKAFEQAAIKANAATQKEIFPFEYEGKKYWVKKARATSSNFFHKLVHKLFSIDVLLPVENKSKEEALLFETNKLKKFKELGINVPSVIGRNNQFFVIENAGKDIHSFIKKRDISKESMYKYIDKMIIMLCSIHNKQQYHGGPQSRNFTYLNENVSIIDFEESFDSSKINLEQLQVRDLLLFLMSLSKTRASFKIDYEYVLNKYCALTNNNQYKVELKSIINKFSFVIDRLDNKLLKKILSEEVNSFVQLFQYIKNLRVS